MVTVAKRILTDAETHLLKGRAMAWAIWFACDWWRKSTLHVISLKWTERMVVVFVLTHASMRAGELCVCLMVSCWGSQKSSSVILKTRAWGHSTIKTVVTHTQKQWRFDISWLEYYWIKIIFDLKSLKAIIHPCVPPNCLWHCSVGLYKLLGDHFVRWFLCNTIFNPLSICHPIPPQVT